MPGKLLFISYYWPPSGGPGALRAVKFARHLPRFGWQPIVLTVRRGEFPFRDEQLGRELPPECKVVRTANLDPFALYKRLTGGAIDSALPVGQLSLAPANRRERAAAWIRANLFLPDARVGWVPFAVFRGVRLAREGKVDLLFTSSPPHSLQIAGWLIKALTGLPWVADLRDPWTGIRYYQFVSRSAATRALDRSLERRILRSADRVVTVSPALAREFGRLGAGPVAVVPNGYDADDFPPRSERPHFIVAHTGNLPAAQNPRTLWQALRLVLERRADLVKDLRIRLIGRVDVSILDTLSQAGLDHYLENAPFMPHEQVTREMMDAALLLVSIPNVENNRGIVTGKLFEYIGTGNPVLVLGPADGDAGQVARAIGNARLFGYDRIEECAEFIERIYTAWQRGELPRTSPAEREPFSRISLTRKLSHVFNEL